MRRSLFSLHRLFVVSIVLKALNGVLEILAGIAAFFVSKDALTHVVELLAREELVEDPRDVVGNYLIQSVRHYTASVQTFITLYLLVHGAVKIFLVVSLLRERRWAYPLAIAVFASFVIYQVYAYMQSFSVSLIVLTILDLAIIALTTLEYRRMSAPSRL